MLSNNPRGLNFIASLKALIFKSHRSFRAALGALALGAALSACSDDSGFKSVATKNPLSASALTIGSGVSISKRIELEAGRSYQLQIQAHGRGSVEIYLGDEPMARFILAGDEALRSEIYDFISDVDGEFEIRLENRSSLELTIDEVTIFQTERSANLIRNGSFEDNRALQWGVSGTYNELAGWDLGADGWVQLHGADGDFTPIFGTRALELDVSFNQQIAQLIATKPNETYQLSFWYHAAKVDAPSDSDAIEIEWGGAPVASLEGAGAQWRKYIYS